MKQLKLLSAFLILITLFSSCVVNDDEIIIEPSITLEELLEGYEIWYVDIEKTRGTGEIPFLQKAFTVSFRNGTFYANNNLVGIGNNGNGFGLDVGFYGVGIETLQIDHDIDGIYDFIVTQRFDNEIELYDSSTNTSYFLIGYQRNTFDYDQVFYDNIHYFLQEYEVWEKSYTSIEGVVNEFDEENFLQFLPFGSGDNFRSSRDNVGTNIGSLFFDYRGHYEVNNIVGTNTLKNLTLDYDYLSNENFELSVINDNRIRLYHPSSNTTYEFRGLGLMRFKNAQSKEAKQNDRKRLKLETFKKLKK